METPSPKVRVFINNNPSCEAEVKHTGIGQTFSFVNVPCMVVSGTVFPIGEQRLQIRVDGNIVGERTVTVSKDGSLNETFLLPEPLDAPNTVQVTGGTFHQVLPVELHRLHGTAAFADGTPVVKPILVTSLGSHELVAVGSQDGSYELVLSEPVTALAILHDTYSVSSLECWVFGVALDSNVRIDPVLGKIEIYRLHAWEGERSLYVHFVPMSLTRMMRGFEQWGPDAGVHPESHPHLDRGDVTVYLGDRQVPLLDFHEISDFLQHSEAGKAVSRPGYLLTVPRGDYRRKVLRVVVRKKTPTIDGTVYEYGEGYFLGFVRKDRGEQ